MSLNFILVDWLQIQGLEHLNTFDDFLTGNLLHEILTKNLENYQNQFITPPVPNKIVNWNSLMYSSLYS